MFQPIAVTRGIVGATLMLCLTMSATAAGAQPPEPLPTQPADSDETTPQPQRAWHPSFSLTSLGYDANVFNQSTNPAGDWVASLAAGLAPFWHVGDVRFSGETQLAYNYFQKYVEERGVDATVRGRVDLPIARARLHVGGSYLNLRQRVNFEIDQRARRTERDANAGIDVAVGGRTTLGLNLRRATVTFDNDAPGALTLRETLNRRENTGTASIQYAITPLTALVVSGDLGAHQFALSPNRDGRSVGARAGMTFSQDAVINGQWTIGWREVTVRNPLVPAFKGLAGRMDLSTLMTHSTRLGLRAGRDVAFSSDELTPYYVQSSIGGSLTQALGDGWQVGVRADRVWLDYVRSFAAPPGTPAYAEAVNVLGGLFGYRFRGGVRFSVEVESMRRRTNSGSARDYRTTRTYTVISKTLGS
jgi:hypothetical protein